MKSDLNIIYGHVSSDGADEYNSIKDSEIENYISIVEPRKRLLVATNNQGKVKEIRRIFEGVYEDVVTYKDLGLNVDTIEDGKTFMENAQKKAREAYEETGYDCLADDSGLCVDALDGAPGIYSARFSGDDATAKTNNVLLMEKLDGVEQEKRSAHFSCAVCLVRNGLPELNAYGEVHGLITTEPKGENGFGYDPYFFVEQYQKTMAELPSEVKNEISHRANALNELKRMLDEQSI